MLWLIPSSLLSSEFFFSGLIPCVCICSRYLGLLGSCQVFVAKASNISEYISPNSFICLVSDMLNIVLFATLVVLFFSFSPFGLEASCSTLPIPSIVNKGKKYTCPDFFPALWSIFDLSLIDYPWTCCVLALFCCSILNYFYPQGHSYYLNCLFIRMRYLPFFFFSPLSLFVPNALTCVLV